MTLVDKIQGTFEKLTGDDTRLNTAEITTIQQAYNALQLGLVKTEFYITQAQNPDVKNALVELRDEFIKPNLDKPRRIMEKTGIPFYNLSVQDRIATINSANVGRVFRDEEILLDSVLAMQATITGMQAGALAAVRGDVRDWFLNSRDAAFGRWKKLGMVTYKTVPQMIPPTMSGVR
jgi:hypothetical protein